jgi:hypothetical protein
MARRPPPARNGGVASRWRRTPAFWRNATKLAGAVVAITGAIVGVAKAWPYVEPYLLAHRGYVLEQVGGVTATTNELLIWKSEDSQERIKSEISGWAIQLQKESDPQQKHLIEQRLRELNDAAKRHQERINRLRGP